MSRTLALLAMCTLQGLAQSPALIKLDVVATDSKGAPVTDLRASDFQLREDGKLQPVVFCRFGGNKRTLEQTAPNEFVNRPAAPATLVLLDRWNATESTMVTAWHDLATAIGHQETVDRLYLYFLANHGELLPVRPLPGNEADLRKIDPPTREQLVARLNESVRSLTGLRDRNNVDPAVAVEATLQALGIVSRMSAIAGPKALIWVTHGFPIQLIDSAGQLVDYTFRVLELAQAAARAGVAIYTVDQSDQGAGANVAGLARQTLERISEQAGGRWYSSGRADDALTGVATDARARYQIAYYAPARTGAPKEHKIRVDCARKGVHLLARAGYLGNEGLPDSEEASRNAFDAESHSPFDATEIGLRATMSRKSGGVHLDIRVDPRDVLLEHRGDRYRARFYLRFAPYRDGVMQEEQPAIHVDFDLTQEQYDTALQAGILVAQDVAVGEGIQQLRAMIFDRGIEALGSVTIPIQ